MAAITTKWDAREAYTENNTESYLMAAVAVYEGSLVMADGSGYLDNASDVAARYFLGVADTTKDNSAGAAGAKRLDVKKKGVYLMKMAGATVADIGKAVYIGADSDTVTLTANNLPVGVIRYIASDAIGTRGDGDYIGMEIDTYVGLAEDVIRRTETIEFIDGFDVGNDADLAVRWDLTQVVGAGTNTETVVDGWNNLVTGGAGGPDMESTRSNGLHLYAGYAPRLECVVDLTAVAAGQTFFFGFWGAANDFAEIIHEPATSANWLIRVDDTAGATTHDSGIAAVAGTPTKLEIWVTAGGVVGAAINDVNVAVAGLDPMTLTAKYVEWRILDVAAAVHTVAVDYFVQEQNKME